MTITIHAAPAAPMPAALIDRWRAVPVAVAVDLLGPGEGQVDPAIRPLCPPGAQPRLFGRALTVLCHPPDFGAVIRALDLVQPGDVLAIAAGGEAAWAMIGEILGGHLRRRGAVGILCDGAVRDVGTLASWPDLAVMARHVTPRGPTGAALGEVAGPVRLGGATVRTGDLLIGDDDGAVVLSPERAAALIDRAEAKLTLEAEWEAALATGTPAAEVFGLS